MKLYIDIAVSLLLLIWPGIMIISIMIFGGPGASNDSSKIYFTLGITSYPILIFLGYLLLNAKFYSFSPIIALALATTIVVVAQASLGYYSMFSNSTKGINNSGYTITDSKIYYDGKEILTTDTEGFEIIGEHAKDSKNVFYEGKIINGANPESFSNIEVYDKITSKSYATDYWKDKTNIYAFGSKILPMASAASFKILDEKNSLALDKNNVYYMYYEKSRIIEGADPNTFKESPSQTAGIDNNYYLDKNSVYFKGFRGEEYGVYLVTRADPESFVHTGTDSSSSTPDAKDSKTTYKNGL